MRGSLAIDPYLVASNTCMLVCLSEYYGKWMLNMSDFAF